MRLRRELQVQLVERLAERFDRLGLHYSSGSQDFYLDAAIMRQNLHLSFIEHQTDFDAVIYVSLRHNGLLGTLNEFAPTWDQSDKNRIASLGNELGILSQGAQRRWSIHSEESVEPACNGMLAEVESFAIPYWQRFSEPEEILRVVSKDDSESWLHSPFHDTRAQTAITAARLLNNQSYFKELVQRKSNYLIHEFVQGVGRFLALAKELDHKWPTRT